MYTQKNVFFLLLRRGRSLQKYFKEPDPLKGAPSLTLTPASPSMYVSNLYIYLQLLLIIDNISFNAGHSCPADTILDWSLYALNIFMNNGCTCERIRQ